MQISGNTTFIPGATSGIGFALALRLQDAGNTVLIGGRRTDVLDASLPNTASAPSRSTSAIPLRC